MKSSVIVIIISAAVLILLISLWHATEGFGYKSSKATPQIPKMAGDYSPLELEILKEINYQRGLLSLNHISLDNYASVKIEMHISICSRLMKVSHNDVENRFSDLREMLSAKRLSEIVVYGSSDTKKLLEKLLASTNHKNILLGDYRNIGISAKLDSNKKMYVGLILMK